MWCCDEEEGDAHNGGICSEEGDVRNCGICSEDVNVSWWWGFFVDVWSDFGKCGWRCG